MDVFPRKSALRDVSDGGWFSALPLLQFVDFWHDLTGRNLILRYATRNRVEDSIGISVNCFHLDCLASEVRLDVDLDVVLTVLANGCYRWLGRQLRGFDKAAPKQLYRKFVETGGLSEIQQDRLVLHFDKRCHNPNLREATLDREHAPIPWHKGLPVEFHYP